MTGIYSMYDNGVSRRPTFEELIDFKKEPIGKGKNGEDVYLRDIWTRREKIHVVVSQIIEPEIIKDVYDKITK